GLRSTQWCPDALQRIGSGSWTKQKPNAKAGRWRRCQPKAPVRFQLAVMASPKNMPRLVLSWRAPRPLTLPETRRASMEGSSPAAKGIAVGGGYLEFDEHHNQARRPTARR